MKPGGPQRYREAGDLLLYCFAKPALGTEIRRCRVSLSVRYPYIGVGNLEARAEAKNISRPEEVTTLIPFANAEAALGDFYVHRHRNRDARACYQRLVSYLNGPILSAGASCQTLENTASRGLIISN